MAEYTPNGIGVPIESLSQIIDRENKELEDSELDVEKEGDGFKSSLASYINNQFQINKSAKRDSGIEKEITDALRAYNGEYSDEDKARITQMELGSAIFMNITATNSRACKSWMADIFLPANDFAWKLDPSASADLPAETTRLIEESIKKEFEDIFKNGQAQNPGQPPTAQQAQETIRELNKRKRDIKDAIAEEIQKEASHNVKIMERQVRDQLQEGGWDHAFIEFLEDFSIFPTAFIKGPVLSKKKKLKWVNGVATLTDSIISLNERVDPYDMYPSPGSKGINDGNLIEHVRFSKKAIMDLKGVPGYIEECIDEVLTSAGDFNYLDFDSNIEAERADQQRRGNESEANRDIIHGLHFHGPIPVSKIREWQPSSKTVKKLKEYNDGDLVEAEAILIGTEVIKCNLNSDPLGRRPYYKASFINRPGAFWGRSLPDLIKDIQRMCNAVARSLANNLAVSAGPQVEVYVDRLADNGDIESIYPMKIWQLKSDPAGNSGRAINFFQPTSNASELLKVYQEFENRAGDTIGIPKLAQGNERTAGLAATASGLSMLLENASKIIKDAIRNVDEGVVKPRVEQEFYINMLKNKPLNFTGDIVVIPRGSSALTIKAAESLRRNEFLAITANPVDQGIMGSEGRAVILKRMSEDLNLPNVIPGPLDLRKKEDEMKVMAQQQAEAEAQKEQMRQQAALQATTIQIEGQKAMAEGAQQLKAQEIQLKAGKEQIDQQIQIAKLQQEGQKNAQKISADLQRTEMETESKERRGSQEIAVKLRTGSGI